MRHTSILCSTSSSRSPFWALFAAVLLTASFFDSSSAAQTVKTVYSFTSSGASQYPETSVTQGRDSNLYGATQGLTYGSVFKLELNGKLTDVHQFDPAGGGGTYQPNAVTLSTDGNFYGTAPFGGSANEGVLFRITAAGVYSVLHEFTGGTDGAYPTAPPIDASDGNLYGTASGLGLFTSTIYQYSKSGGFKALYQFDSAHGVKVVSGVIQASDGNLYGTAAEGGTNGCGTIFGVTTSGVPLPAYSFPCGSGGKYPAAGLVQGSDGSFYGTTFFGGNANNDGTVFKMDTKGAVSIVYAFQNGKDGTNPSGSLVQGTDGNLYGVTAGGGSAGIGTLYQISTAGLYRRIYTFLGDAGQFPIQGLLQHTNGLFYGAANLGGANNYGSVYSLNVGLGRFVTFVRASGKVGRNAQILGTGLTGATSVTFNGVPALTFSVARDSYMTAVVPAGATTGPVVVNTPAGTFTSNPNFIVVP